MHCISGTSALLRSNLKEALGLFDYGVIVFDNTSVVTNYFHTLDVEIGPEDFSSSGVQLFADFATLKTVDHPNMPSPTATAAAFGAYEKNATGPAPGAGAFSSQLGCGVASETQ